MRKEIIYLLTEGIARSISKYYERDRPVARQPITNTIRWYVQNRWIHLDTSNPFPFSIPIRTIFFIFVSYAGLVSSWYERSFEEVLRYEQMEPTTTNMEKYKILE